MPWKEADPALAIGEKELLLHDYRAGCSLRV